MHLPLGDQGEGVRAELDRFAVDEMTAASGANPDQLVVRVPVRRAQRTVSDAPNVELDHLERVRLGAKIVDHDVRHD
jgi:hypothetical protein